MTNYHARMMNIPCVPMHRLAGTKEARTRTGAYSWGHKDARHAAAEIANEADAELTRLRFDLEVHKRLVDEWTEKTDWVQTEFSGGGMGCAGQHRADTMTAEIDRLRSDLAAMREALQGLHDHCVREFYGPDYEPFNFEPLGVAREALAKGGQP